MVTDSEHNTDSKPEIEQEETANQEQLQDSSPETTTDEGGATDTDAGTATASFGGVVAGVGAVVSAGLGLSSVTGTSLGDMLRSRKEIVGQIEASTGGGGDQVEAFFGAPWHTAALVNGIVALVAIVIGGVALATLTGRADTRPWVKAVALGGMVLGAIGLLVAGGMYFDLFADQPVLPAGPAGTGP